MFFGYKLSKHDVHRLGSIDSRYKKFPSSDSRPSAPCPQQACSIEAREIPLSSGNEPRTVSCKAFSLGTGPLQVLLDQMRSEGLVQLLERRGRWSAQERPPPLVNLLEG